MTMTYTRIYMKINNIDLLYKKYKKLYVDFNDTAFLKSKSIFKKSIEKRGYISFADKSSTSLIRERYYFSLK